MKQPKRPSWCTVYLRTAFLLYIRSVHSFLISELIAITFGHESPDAIVKKIVNCRGFQNAPIQWTDVAMDRDFTTKKFTFSLKLKVLKEVSTKFAMEFNFWKCDSEGNLDSCEYVLKEHRNNNICNLIVQKNQLWSVFIQRFEPPLKCPIKAGTYEINKCPFAADFMKLIPVKEAVWKGRLKGFDNNQTISCVDIEIKLY